MFHSLQPSSSLQPPAQDLPSPPPMLPSCALAPSCNLYPPICRVLFEEFTFPSSCTPTSCSPSSSLSPIPHTTYYYPMDVDLLQADPLADFILLPVLLSQEVPDLEIPSCPEMSPLEVLQSQLNLMDTAFSERSAPDLDAVIPRLSHLTISEPTLGAVFDPASPHLFYPPLPDSQPSSPLPPLHHRQRPARSRRSRVSTKQSGELHENIMRHRFASGSDRNRLAEELGLPASEIFNFYRSRRFTCA